MDEVLVIVEGWRGAVRMAAPAPPLPPYDPEVLRRVRDNWMDWVERNHAFSMIAAGV